MEILFNKYNFYNVLLKSLLLIINIRVGIYFKYVGVMGVDSWLLNNDILKIIDNGNIFQSYEKYIIFNSMQINSSIISIISSVSVKTSEFLSNCLSPILISILLLFLFKKSNSRFLLVAYNIFFISDFIIQANIQPMTWTYALSYYILLFYIIINNYKKIIYYIINMSIIISHPFTSTLSFILLISYIIYIKIYRIKSNIKIHSIISVIALTIIYWIYMSYLNYKNETIVFISYLQPIYESLIEFSIFSRTEIYETIGTNFYIQQLYSIIDILGFGILIVFGIYSSLLILSKNHLKYLYLIYTTFIIFLIPFTFGLFGQRVIMNYRWFTYGYVTLAILFSY
jgi:hypothetical protein